MISVKESKRLVLKTIVENKKTTSLSLSNTKNEVLAEDIFSPCELPHFNQSNVDGYAVRFDREKTNSWKLIGEIKAGDKLQISLKEGEACRVFTGAEVPENSDAVIMQEYVLRNKESISSEKTITLGQQLRKKGSQIKKGKLALKKGQKLNPQAVGFLNMLGIKEVEVFCKPKVKLIITGNELQNAGENLEPGKVFESNSNALKLAFGTLGIVFEEILFVKDDRDSLLMATKVSLDADFLIFSGGISVGDYDFVRSVLDECQVECVFHKIAQKPGKPLYFGQKENKYVFALPGNPASALTCFYEYVFPALNQFMGNNFRELMTINVPLLKGISKKEGLANFLKGHFDGAAVLPLVGQDSFIMKSFSEANCFIYLNETDESKNEGDFVEIHLLPY
jgi:molybdopterin molybdotransferase